MKATKTFYLDEHLKLTSDQAKGAFIVVNEGQEITPDMLERHPSLGEQKADKVKAASPSENKMKSPVSNK